jgi:hypothetical protein
LVRKLLQSNNFWIGKYDRRSHASCIAAWAPSQESLELFADERAGVDYTTHNAIQPLAKAVLDGRPGANDILAQASLSRASDLAAHPRVATSTEPMRFNGSTAHLKGRITQEEAWHRCRQFAIEIFTAASIDHADFDAHPERLTDYLETDVSSDVIAVSSVPSMERL